jgi:hypothetical protein
MEQRGGNTGETEAAKPRRDPAKEVLLFPVYLILGMAACALMLVAPVVLLERLGWHGAGRFYVPGLLFFAWLGMLMWAIQRKRRAR